MVRMHVCSVRRHFIIILIFKLSYCLKFHNAHVQVTSNRTHGHALCTSSGWDHFCTPAGM